MGGAHLQNNQISYLSVGWSTKWKIIILQRFSHRHDGSEPRVRLLSPGAWYWEEGPPEPFGFEGWQGLLQELQRARGRQEPHSWRAHTRRSHVYQDPAGRAATSQESGPDAPAGPRGSSCKAGGSLWGQEHWWQRFWGMLTGVSCPEGYPFNAKSQPHPTAWDASSQKINRVGTYSYSADKLLKVFLSSELPLNTTFATALPTKERGPSSTHQGADTRRKMSYNPVANGTTKRERQTKWDDRGIGSRWRNNNRKLSGDRQCTWERTECNDRKEDPKSWKKSIGTDQEDARNVQPRARLYKEQTEWNIQ